MALIEIRQKLDPITKKMDLSGKLERAAYPGAHGGSYLRKDMSGWLTGLKESEEKEYGKILGKDLTKQSEYWLTYFVPTLSTSGGFIQLDPDNNLEDKILYKAAIASRIVAPSKEDLSDYKFNNTQFYFYSVEKNENNQKELKRFKNKLIAKLNNNETSKEWLLFVNKALGLIVNPGISIDRLYNDLDNTISKISSVEEGKRILEIFDKNPMDLQVEFVVHNAIDAGVILYEGKQYMFDGFGWGTTKDEIVSKMSKTQSAESFDKLKKQVLSKFL